MSSQEPEINTVDCQKICGRKNIFSRLLSKSKSKIKKRKSKESKNDNKSLEGLKVNFVFCQPNIYK